MLDDKFEEDRERLIADYDQQLAAFEGNEEAQAEIRAKRADEEKKLEAENLKRQKALDAEARKAQRNAAIRDKAFAIFEIALIMGTNIEEARTVSVGVFTFGQMFYLFNCRSFDLSMRAVGYFSNLWVWIGSALMIAFHVMFTYLPPMNVLFHSHPMDAEGWIKCIAVGIVIFTMIGLEKKLRYRHKLKKRNQDYKFYSL